jgi:arylsulfatase A-like enzyme
MMRTIITPLLFVALVFIVAQKTRAATPEQRKPNILLILVDDVGYCDIAAFATHLRKTSSEAVFFETPRIDQLAKQGTMFTQFYACTVCSPTRASLMTGKMSSRLGMWDAYATVKTTFEKTGKTPPKGCDLLDNEPWDEYHYSKTDRGVTVPVAATTLHASERIIPQALKGYHTAFIGKWHLGSHNHAGYRPADRGFQEILAYFDGGGSSYIRPFKAVASASPRWDDPGPDLTPREDYLSDDMAQRVNRFLADRVANHADEPFFLYFAHPACHTPLEARADDKNYFKDKAKKKGWVGPADPVYAGVVKGMDRSMGSILDKLDELKLSDNTAVIFMSDNGGLPSITSSLPLRGGKSMLYEGGIRVPMIIRWPGKTQAGAVCDVPCDVADIFPTILTMTGTDDRAYKTDPTADGQSLAPLLADLSNVKRDYPRTEFYHFYGKMGYTGFHTFATWATLRKGDYKLHYDYVGKVELYNIREDIGEATNLVNVQPQRAHDMLVQLTTWLKANCHEAYLPKPNPQFNPAGSLPYGPYIPLEELKQSLLKGTSLVQGQ